MAGYYFIKSGGHLFKLTKKAYGSWVTDSANRLKNKKKPAKLRNYGADIGPISNVISANDFEVADFIRTSQLFSLDTETNS